MLPEKGGGGGRTKQDKPTITSAKTKGVSYSCGQLCKNFRDLKLHQIKAKCQASENKLTGPDKRCFVSLTDILNPIQAGVFWNDIGWGGQCAPSVPP